MPTKSARALVMGDLLPSPLNQNMEPVREVRVTAYLASGLSITYQSGEQVEFGVPEQLSEEEMEELPEEG